MRRGRSLVLATVIVAGSMGTTPSFAAFPGTNGRIAFDSDRDGNAEIYVMDPGGANQTRLTNNPAADDVKPVWSPDGTRLLFWSDRDGGHDVYVMNSDGSGVTRLTTKVQANRADASWSPDGSMIAFSSDRDGDREIYVMDSDGSGQTRLTFSGGEDQYPSWSPDGSKIAFESRRTGDFDVYVMDTDGSNPINLTNHPEEDGYPDWSPDGTKIVFQSTRDNTPTYAILVMNADGSSPVRLTDSAIYNAQQRWSPDGTKIVFQSLRDGNYELYSMNADGSSQIRLTNNSSLDGLPDWQPAPSAPEGYPRPKGATPLRVSLVPAYLGCSSSNLSHGEPLAFPSCSPPNLLSQYLTVGTPDANGSPANSVGFVRLAAAPGDPSTEADEADVKLMTSLTDVRIRQDLSDYTGELMASIGLRITDRYNAPSLTTAATTVDTALSWAIPCTSTSATNIGSLCALSTSVNSLVPGTVSEGKRSIWALKQVQVSDGGEDGQGVTTGDNTPFAKQGIFIP